jgi:putative NADPH-quinone reductase
MDLYSPENAQPFLKFEDVATDWPTDDAVMNAVHQKITDADELVIVAPIWWGQVPAIMKNFLDTNFGAGFAFKYEKG